MQIGMACVKRSMVFVGMLVFAALARQSSGQDDAVKNGMQTIHAMDLCHTGHVQTE